MTHGGDTRPTVIWRRFQFSLSALLLAVLLVALACGVVRWLDAVWIVPAAVLAASAACLVFAARRRLSWRMLRLGLWHAAIWLLLGAVASAFAVQGCRRYNEVAGTDKTDGHIARIGAMTLAGPLVGPVANPGAGDATASEAERWAVILCGVQLGAVAPALFVRRLVAWPVALICWLAFVAATLLWFYGAMISLMVCLS